VIARRLLRSRVSTNKLFNSFFVNVCQEAGRFVVQSAEVFSTDWRSGVLEFGDVDSTLETPSASDNAARVLRAMIYSGQLPPGHRLPSGIELAKRLGISVVTLRVALKSLESTGYLVIGLGAHGGARVSNAEGLTRCWTQWMIENADQIEDIFELRMAIETHIAALAAERRSDEDLDAIERANALLAGPNPEIVPWNVAFHNAVADAAHSRLLADAMRDVRGTLFLPVDLARYEHQITELRAAHAAVLEGIRDRDPESAVAAMRAHLLDTLEVFKRSLGRIRRRERRQPGA
jgi:GntR family transcriptional repressor for pyruvate dehydrogenase complex